LLTLTSEQNPVAVDAGQNPATTAADAGQDLITSVAETTGRVAAKVSNVIDSLTDALKSRRNKKG
jgi:hypothetical protein